MNWKNTIRTAQGGMLLMLIVVAALPLADAQSKTPAVSLQDATNDLSMAVGRSVLLDCAQPVQRVAIGSPLVAEAVAMSPTEAVSYTHLTLPTTERV